MYEFLMVIVYIQYINLVATSYRYTNEYEQYLKYIDYHYHFSYLSFKFTRENKKFFSNCGLIDYFNHTYHVKCALPLPKHLLGGALTNIILSL